jgi:hypothetical protein
MLKRGGYFFHLTHEPQSIAAVDFLDIGGRISFL